MTARPAVTLFLLALLLRPAAAWADGLTVFAAASLTEALRDAAVAWQRDGHAPLRLSFAASSTLARQIEQGAPADLFASADARWMDDVARHGLVAPGSRRDLLGNALVLVVPAAHAAAVTIAPGFDLAALLGRDGRLAVADPAHVPAGIYAAEALQRLGIWASVANRLAPAEDVRAALLLVERGEAPAGIVYATDAAVATGVAVAGTFPADSHAPIVYPFALTPHGDTPDGRALLRFLEGDTARAIFTRRGFTMEPRDP
jgi:molybdate transport system substrate-binding protein